jgi:hypothetical protein
LWRKLPDAADLASSRLVKGRSGKLTELILARLPGRASASIVIVTALIVAGLVAAAFFIPARFMNVLWGSDRTTPAATAAIAEVAPTPARPALAPTMKPQAVKAASASAPASKPAAPATPKAAGDVVANTFQTIFAGPNGPSLEQPARAAKPAAPLTAALPPATSAPKSPPAEGKGVVTRVVDTLVIHADPKTGAIEIPALAPADGAAPPVPAEPDAKTPKPAAAQPAAKPASAATATAETPAAEEAAPIPLAPPPALAARPATPPPSIVASAKAAPATAAKPATAKPAAAPAASEYAIIGGKGVSVRSGPGTAHNALFTLAAGKKVAVSDKEHGWLHITDAEGRSGWLYSGLVEITKN